MKKTSPGVVRLGLVKTVDLSYDLVFDKDFSGIPADLRKRGMTDRIAIITDKQVGGIYAGELSSALASEGLEAMVFPFEPGEEYKTWDTAGMLLNQMGHAGYGRDTIIIVLGGGVVGDTGGFVAAVTRRGVPLIQIPTSTLAMADSAIGGKTAVDLEAGKNLAGAFKHPAIVYFIMRTLDTLSPRHLRAGFSETIKHGVIRDAELFSYMEKNAHLLLDKNRQALEYIAEKNCMIKGTVVELDDEEGGLRKILNFGHTVGHAVEALSGYKLPHGECVAIGSMVAGRIAIAMKTGFTEHDLERMGTVFQAYDQPITVPDYVKTPDILKKTRVDKKAEKGQAKYCLATGIGEMHPFGGSYSVLVDPEVAAKAIDMSR
jgi:3-dehydroquinate synthase